MVPDTDDVGVCPDIEPGEKAEDKSGEGIDG